MIRDIERRSVSLLELYRRAKLAERVRRGEQTTAEDRSGTVPSGFVDPRDDRGVRYPGDFPNDLERFYRGCF
jgi:hypothetical protein